jgi:Putative porin
LLLEIADRRRRLLASQLKVAVTPVAAKIFPHIASTLRAGRTAGMPLRIRIEVAVAALLLPAPAVLAADNTDQRQSLEELRNTVVNLLQALVDKHLLTREQAEALVKQAQDKASADAAVSAAQKAAEAKEEENAVRVPYVPQIVKDEIAQQVASELGPSVKKELVDQVGSKGSLFSALPGWVQRMRWSGDIRLRGEADDFANDNATNSYLDFNQINTKGGIAKAGPLAFLNTTEDQKRLRLRLRFGFDTELGSGWTTGMRLATGSIGEVIATTNQTLGTYGAGYTVTIDQAYLKWTGQSSSGDHVFSAYGGRFASPWLATDLVWYNDLTFEGVVSNYRWDVAGDENYRHDLFATVAAMPLTSFSPFDSNPTNQQKWLLGGQLGVDLHFENDDRLRFGAAYYDYVHIVGQRNAPESTLLNWTAPAFVQKGNTMFDISNTVDPTVNLFALASDYKIVDLIAIGDLAVFSRYSVALSIEALKNVGFKTADVMARTGTYVAPRTSGYRADVGFGTNTPPAFGAWHGAIGYRYLQRDAVLDAFNDEDFHLGGTDARGYTLMFDYWFNPLVWLRLKYMSANEIDGPRLGIDVWQVDMNAQF